MTEIDKALCVTNVAEAGNREAQRKGTGKANAGGPFSSRIRQPNAGWRV
jgi:hypothetical protein